MGLLVWLPLNGNLNNQGLSDVTVTVSGTTSYISGKIGQALSCNGSSYWIISSITLTQTTSICWWIKTTDTNAMPWVLTAAGYANTNFWIYDGYYYLNTGDGANNPFQNNGSNVAALTDGNWHHYAITFDGTNCLLYIDGIYKGKAKTYKSPVTSNNTIKLAGGFSNAHNYDTLGSLNDFRVYDHCLSAKEISEIAKALVLHYKLDELSNNNILPLGYQQLEYIESSGTSYFNTNLKFNPESDSFNIVFKGNDTANNGMIFASSGGVYFWLYYYSSNGIRIYANNGNGQQGIAGIASDLNKHVVEFKNKHYYIDNIDKGTLSNTYTSISYEMWLFSYGGSGYPFKGRVYYLSVNISNENRVFIPAKRLSDSAVGMYEFITDTFYTSSNESFIAGPAINSTISIADVSGYRHDGTAVEALEISNDTPRYKYCLTNANTYPLYSIFSIEEFENITISCWVKLTAWGKQTSGLWATSSSTTSPSDYTTTTCNHRDSGFDIRGTNGTTYRLSCTSSHIPLNTWKHVVFRHNGTTAQLFINGVATTNVNCSTKLVGFNAIFLGYSLAGGAVRQCQGSWSDFRIYATALSDDDILELYYTAASVDNTGNLFTYKFEEK